MKTKKILAAVLTFTMVFAAAVSTVPRSTFFSTSITANAEGESFLDAEAGVLTLRGNITKEEVDRFRTDPNVKHIIAEKGCILPEDCSKLFYGL